MGSFISKIIRITILISVIITLGFANTQVAANNDSEITITTIEKEINTPMGIKGNKIGVARSEQVRMNPQGIEQIANNLRVNQGLSQQAKFQIFENFELNANFAEIEDTIHSGYIMRGNLNSDPNSLITLVSTDGIVSANFEYQGKQYHLKSDEYGNYSFEEIDQSQFPEELDAIPEGADTSESFADESFDVPLNDGGYVIDVMVVYTSAARTRVGGTSQMQNLINLAVSETNTGYQRSGVTSTMRLVNSVEINYSEANMSSSTGWNTALSNLTNKDGVIDNVHDLRDTYGADLVVMIVDSSIYCGLGWLMTPTYQKDTVGFSLVSQACATGYYSFAHETGHNMGAHHDRATAGSSTAMYSYSYGYQAPDSSFRTIMAYNCSSGCPRVNQWSNPDVYYNNQPTGVISTAPNSADNRLTLNKTASIVANFKSPKVTPTAPSNLVVQQVKSTSISVTYTDNSSDELGFKVERSINGGAWTSFATLPANTNAFTDNIDVCGNNFSYRVYAFNNNGNSAYSNTATTGLFSCSAPDPISDLKVFSSTNSITLDWSADTETTSYEIQVSNELTKPVSLDSGFDVTQIPFTITGLEKGVTYSITIISSNEFGSTINDPISVTTSAYAIFLPLTTKN